MANTIAWIGIIISLVAKIAMANHRFIAVKLLFVATAISAGWAVVITDWQSVVLHLMSCVLMVRTLRSWYKEKQ